MSDYELDALEEADRQDVAVIEEAERSILEIARRTHPTTLADLRRAIDASGSDLDPSVVRAALWSLLNKGRGARLALLPDRSLTVAS